jgi:Fur family transcriptional regulator, ferric uptake regulator
MCARLARGAMRTGCKWNAAPRGAGYRTRRVIAEVLSRSRDHPDVVELHRRARKRDDGIFLATVYRTVRRLEAKGIVERHEFGDRRSRYKMVTRKHHDHLINLEKGESS